MLGDYETAEDVTHEAFIALIEHRNVTGRNAVTVNFPLRSSTQSHSPALRRRGYQLEDQMEDEARIAAPSERARIRWNDSLAANGRPQSMPR